MVLLRLNYRFDSYTRRPVKSVRLLAEMQIMGRFFDVDFSLFRPLEFFVDPKNGDGRNNNPPAMRVRVDCYTKKLPFRVQ